MNAVSFGSAQNDCMSIMSSSYFESQWKSSTASVPKNATVKAASPSHRGKCRLVRWCTMRRCAVPKNSSGRVSPSRASIERDVSGGAGIAAHSSDSDISSAARAAIYPAIAATSSSRRALPASDCAIG